MICFFPLIIRPVVVGFATGFCILLVASTAHAQTESPSFQIQYAAENDYISAGTASWSLIKDANRWVMRLSTSPTRLIRLAGVGKIVETTVLSAPEPPFKVISYSYSDSKRKRKNYSAVASNTDDEIVITRRDKTITVPMSEVAVIDRLSATLMVATELTVNPDFDSLNISVLDRNGVRDMIFHNLGLETIKLGKKTFDTYVVESGRPGSSRKTRTWFASMGSPDSSSRDSSSPDSNSPDSNRRPLPVKIEQYKNQELVLRLSLVKYTQH